MKITSEDKSEFRDIVSTEGYKVVLKVLQALIKSQEQDMLRYRLDSGSQEEKDKLAKLKFELDGATKLYNNFRAFEKRLRNEPDGRMIGPAAKAV